MQYYNTMGEIIDVFGEENVIEFHGRKNRGKHGPTSRKFGHKVHEVSVHHDVIPMLVEMRMLKRPPPMPSSKRRVLTGMSQAAAMRDGEWHTTTARGRFI